ncbi:MAG: sterol desaturase family protein [Deltaproteobacteria bacterium]|nr:sterol desaturase family protein [Deltaproteobacteria bacterium]
MEYFGIDSDNKFLVPILYFMDPRQRVYWLYLLTSTVVAAAIYLIQRRSEAQGENSEQGLLEFLVPRSIVNHRSARTDYIYFVLNAILYSFILAPFFFLYTVVSGRTFQALAGYFGQEPPDQPASALATLAYTVCVALALDFSLFIAHYIFHRFPLLWQFHKVHHSAQVMTPMTVYRMHPVDDIVTISFTVVIGGLVDSFFRFFFMPNVTQITVWGLNLLIFVFYIVGYHLRHSHVWLSYGRRLSNVLISPAQHQIHHSKAAKHWDKNFGFMLAIWDRAFGTLYVPREKEQLEFGIGEEEGEYSTVFQLYFTPFRKAYGIVRQRLRRILRAG